MTLPLASLLAAALSSAGVSALLPQSIFTPNRVTEITLFLIALTVSLFTLFYILSAILIEFRIRQKRDLQTPPIQIAIAMLSGERSLTVATATLLAAAFLFAGIGANLLKSTNFSNFHYYLMQEAEYSDAIHYYSGDKSYLIGSYEIQAADLYLYPFHYGNADPKNLLHLMIRQKGYLRINPLALQPPVNEKPRSPDMSPHLSDESTSPLGLREKILSSAIDGRATAQIEFRPEINPASGEIVRRGPSGAASRKSTPLPSILSSYLYDMRIMLDSVNLATESNLDINHLFEYYYHFSDRSTESYFRLFPPSVIASFYTSIHPLLRFVRIGSILFLISALFLIRIPGGERK
jgi:hypothetical protein